MTEEREAELLRKVPSLRDKGQVKGFRKYLVDEGEIETGRLKAALDQQERKVPCPLMDD